MDSGFRIPNGFKAWQSQGRQVRNQEFGIFHPNRSQAFRRSTMARGLPREARAAGRDERDEGSVSLPSLDIQIDEREGRLRIYDPRAFHEDRRAFCRRLLEAAL